MPPKWSVNALASWSVWPATGSSDQLGWKRLPTLELQQVWPRSKAVPAQPGHRALHMVSSSQWNNWVQLMFPQRSYKMNCFSPAAIREKKPHFQWKTDPSGLTYFPQTWVHLAQTFGHYGWSWLCSRSVSWLKLPRGAPCVIQGLTLVLERPNQASIFKHLEDRPVCLSSLLSSHSRLGR